MPYVPGPYDREHGHLVWGGALPGGETWSCSLRMAETEDAVLTNDAAGWDVQELLDHYTTLIQGYHANAETRISNRAKLQYVKFNRVDIQGRYIDDNTFINTFADVAGGVTSGAPANQLALCVTLTTAVSRGPASKGRFYLPVPTASPDATTGLISAGEAAAIAAATKTFLEAISDVPGLDDPQSPGVCVMSRKSGAPMTRRVSGVRVGRVLDTQRRRRRSLLENYVLESVDQGAA